MNQLQKSTDQAKSITVNLHPERTVPFDGNRNIKNAIELASIPAQDAIKYTPIGKLLTQDRKSTVEAISHSIVWALSFMGEVSAPPPQRIPDMAEMIIQNHPLISIPTLLKALQKGISGQYGKLYRHVDLALINEWIVATYEEIIEYREHQNHLTKSINIDMDSSQIEKTKQIVNQIINEKNKENASRQKGN